MINSTNFATLPIKNPFSFFLKKLDLNDLDRRLPLYLKKELPSYVKRQPQSLIIVYEF